MRKNPGSSVKLFEYLACAKPVIASRAGGYGRIVREAQAGLEVDAENPDSVAQAIGALIKDKGLREKMGRNWPGRPALVGGGLFM